MELSAGKLWGLRRIADAAGRFKMTAVDQRPPIKNLVAERRGTPEAPYDDVANVKSLLVEELAATSSAMLLDPHYAYPRAIQYVRPSQGLILTLEDSVFEETPQAAMNFSDSSMRWAISSYFSTTLLLWVKSRFHL